MGYLRFFIILSLQFFLFSFIFSINPYVPVETFSIQGKDWKVFQQKNISSWKTGSQIEFQLEENKTLDTDQIDLFLDFENLSQSTPNYQVIYSQYERNKYQNKNGKYSGKFYLSQNYISLLPQPKSLFAPGNIPGSFTIEFWLYLYKNYDNQYVIRYQGDNLSDEGDKNKYGFSIFTKNNRLMYQFDNFFWTEAQESHSLTISEEDKLPLYQWEHHAITFNILNGKVTTYKNGVEQEVKWMTAGGKILSPILNPKVKEELSSPIIIGQNALFSLDNLLISRNEKKAFYLKKHLNEESHILTDVYEFSQNSADLKKILVESKIPDFSALRLSYRISEKYFTPDNPILQWVTIQNGLDRFPEKHQSGKYIQFKLTAFPYEDNSEPLTIQSIKVDYTADKNPYVPVLTDIDAQDRKAELHWIPTPEDDIKGYEIYYGYRSGEYLGKGAAEGNSPVFYPAPQTGDLKPMKMLLTGLKNEQPYFIAVRAIDGRGHKSPYSRELYVRPSAIYNSNRYSIAGK